MKMIQRMLALLAALLMLALPALAEGSPEDVLATVNGAAVTRATYQARLEGLQDVYASYGYDVTDPTIAAVLAQIALDNVVEYALLDSVIAANGLELTEEELADAAQIAREDFYLQVDQIVDQYGEYGLADISTEEGRAAALERAWADHLWSLDGVVTEEAVATTMDVLISSGLYEEEWSYDELVDMQFVLNPMP